MLLIPLGLNNKWVDIYRKHQYMVNSENIYFNTLRLVNKHHKILDRDTFVEYYKNITNDIELKSHPIDIFIPNDDMDAGLENEDGETPQIVKVSHDTPEYKHIAERLSLEDLYATIPVEHPVHIAMKDKPGNFDKVVDDIVLYWAVFKFIEQIEVIRRTDIRNMKDIIDYTVTEITLDKWKSFIESKRINYKKIKKWMEDNFFGPDMDHTMDFYKDGPIKVDIMDLLNRLCTNIVFNNDIYIIISVYLILWLAKDDIAKGDAAIEKSDYARYVRDVIAKI